MTLDGGNFSTLYVFTGVEYIQRIYNRGNFSTMDPFTYTKLDLDKIKSFDFFSQNQEKIEKVKIDEIFCTLVTIGGKYLEKKTLKKVLKKIDEIR